MPRGEPSIQEIHAAYQRLSPKEQGFADALNEISVEALCLKMRNQLGPYAYAQWIHEFNTFAHRWSNQFSQS